MGDVALSDSALSEMESLQDEVLARLDELNARIEELLAAETGSAERSRGGS